MLILTFIGAAALFLGSLLLGEIYLPAGAVLAVLLINIALFVTGRGKVTRENILLLLWFILLSHRSFIPREGLTESGSLFFVEVMATMGVLFGSALVLALSLPDLKLRIFESRFWLLAYTGLAGASLLWTPAPYYSGFWLIRLVCIAVIVLVYFSNADREACRRFFLMTLLASVPVIVLPIIGYVTGTSTSQLGAHRVAGYWVHPSVVSMAAYSVAAASITILFQRDNRPFLLHLLFLIVSCTSGFLAAGKTGAVGGTIAFASMLLLGRRFRLWIGTMAVGVVGYLVYVFFLQHLEVGLFAHLEGYNLERLQTLESRFELWGSALRVWADSVPSGIFGRGFTSYRADPLPSTTGWAPGHPHSGYVNLLVDAGVVGTVFFLAMLVRPFLGAIRVAARAPLSFTESLEFPALIAMIPLIIGGMVDDAFGGTLQPTSYLTIGITLTLDRLLYLRQTAMEAPAEALVARAERFSPLTVATPPRT
jgi:O-antigen ligase